MALDAGEEGDQVLSLQLQQFMDEWHYRVIHSGLASTTDRETCLSIALSLFEHGARTSLDKASLMKKDQVQMVEELVASMPSDTRKSFSHFALQLQLVIASTTRVRHALEDGDAQEVTKIMEEGDAGINQLIMRSAVVEAAVEVNELDELHQSWSKNMSDRITRLNRCAEDADLAQTQLQQINGQLGSFADEQNAKSKKVLMSIAGNSDKMLYDMVFKSWAAYHRQYMQDKSIHEMFKRQIEDAKLRLIEYRSNNKAGTKKMLMRKASAGDKQLKEASIRGWLIYVQEEKDEREMGDDLAKARAKLDQFKSSQQANTKKVMMRMSAGNDASLVSAVLQGWAKYVKAEKANAGYNQLMREAEEKLAETMSNASAEAKQVIGKMFGDSERGIKQLVRSGWTELWKAEKREKELDEAVGRANDKFANLSAARKKIVKNVAERTNHWEQELITYKIFQEWSTQAKIERMIKYYGTKMDTKKHQLDAVQSMFKSFATQLESGIKDSPRSHRKSQQSSDKAVFSSAKPPSMPPGH